VGAEDAPIKFPPLWNTAPPKKEKVRGAGALAFHYPRPSQGKLGSERDFVVQVSAHTLSRIVSSLAALHTKQALDV